MDTRACECEHKKHKHSGGRLAAAHPYWKSYSVRVAVKTPYGTFRVCQKCADTCLAQYHQPQDSELRLQLLEVL